MKKSSRDGVLIEVELSERFLTAKYSLKGLKFLTKAMDRVFLKAICSCNCCFANNINNKEQLDYDCNEWVLKTVFSYKKVFLKLHFTVMKLNRNRIKPVS